MTCNHTTWAPNFRAWVAPERLLRSREPIEHAQPAKKVKQGPYVVQLTDDERCDLMALVLAEKSPAYKVKRARILLRLDKNGLNWTDAKVAKSMGCCKLTVRRTRHRMAKRGLEAALAWEQTRSHRTTVDRTLEAQLLALLDQEPPFGRSRWSCRRLAERLVELKVVPAISRERVRKILKCAASNLNGQSIYFEQDEASAAAIEDMLARHRQRC